MKKVRGRLRAGRPFVTALFPKSTERNFGILEY